ncbi:EF-hand domain-containing protein [Xylophilus rhododendri]|uniref:EF-hand domain-containing protein n=1 Tax=Xylophilus rhododendri TaxID=2697032 RepID=A0A857JEA3_9BURK|nr:EF-hand domain-containing protein [Xylophilus rhododendri]
MRLPLLGTLALCCAVSALAQNTVLETIPGTPSAAEAASTPVHSKGEELAAKQFGWLDANRDGYLSRDEVALFPRLRDAFDEADQDHDNRVSFDEIRGLAAQKRAERARAEATAPANASRYTEQTTPKVRPVPMKEW